MPADRPVALVVSWAAPNAGGASNRGREMAHTLGGDALLVYPVGGFGAARKLARYALSMPLTFFGVLRRRPRAVVAQNPPVFCALAAFLAAKILRVPVVLDSHPGGFGLQGDTLSLKLQPLLRWMVPRSGATLVTETTLKATVDGWGGHGVVFHEAPPQWQVEPATELAGGPLRVLYVGTFTRDEPIDAVMDAARAYPAAQFVVTGNVTQAPPGLIDAAPSNVTFCGYLAPDGYVAALREADVVLVLTTEPTSVARSGYDAVWAHRPLVITESEASLGAFPLATHVANDGPAVAAALERIQADLPAQRAATLEARTRADEGWELQRTNLRRAVGLAG